MLLGVLPAGWLVMDHIAWTARLSKVDVGLTRAWGFVWCVGEVWGGASGGNGLARYCWVHLTMYNGCNVRHKGLLLFVCDSQCHAHLILLCMWVILWLNPM